MAHGMAHAQQGATPRRGAHVANEPTRDGVGLGNPIERFLASTGRGKRRRVGRELQMAEHLPDHLGLGDGGNDPERATAAKGTCGHSQRKHAPQESLAQFQDGVPVCAETVKIQGRHLD
jgi:hypothetical protein